jgi:formylmethanofuran dehydrogenase subunit D
MGGISGLLVTVRSAKQGAEMMANKLSAEYGREISSLRINPDDMKELAVSEGQPVRMASPYGEVTVTCQPADVPRRTFFLPLGPVANQLFSGANTDGTGVPDWQRQPVTIQACERVLAGGTDRPELPDSTNPSVAKEAAALNTESTVVHHNVVCTFCGCLCDDIEVEVHDNQISKVKKACLIGRNKIMHSQSNTDHPNAGPFVAYPLIIRLLMDLDFRRSWLDRIHPQAKRVTCLHELTREYTLEEIAIVTRAGPARALGLTGKGHLGSGADADVAVYRLSDDRQSMFTNAAYVIKGGQVVVRSGEVVESFSGKTLGVELPGGRQLAPDLAEYFEQYSTVKLDNYVVEDEYVPDLELIACR